MAMVYKKLNDEEQGEFEKHSKVLANDETWLHCLTNQRRDEECSTGSTIVEPPNGKQLQRMKELRLTHLKMKAISREIITYLIFTGVLFVWAFMSRDYLSYYQTVGMEETMHLKTRSLISKKSKSSYPYKKVIATLCKKARNVLLVTYLVMLSASVCFISYICAFLYEIEEQSVIRKPCFRTCMVLIL